MAINPIQIFQTEKTDFVRDVLQNASSVISGVMDRAVAIGRDNVNNQQRMQSDLLSMRAQETALAQRRGEGIQKLIQDTQNRARDVYENDRNFDAQQQQLGVQNSRAAANDLFSQELQTDNFALNVANTASDNARADRQLGLAEKKLTADQETANKESQFYRDLYSQPDNGVPPLLRLTTPVSRGSLDLQLEGAVKSQDANAARRIQGQIDALPPEASLKPPTRADLRAEESLDMRKDALATKAQQKEIETLVADTTAFLPQSATLGEKATANEIELAKAFDKDKLSSELNSAQNMTLDQYLNMGQTDPSKIAQINLSPAATAKRKKLWEYANANGNGAEPTPNGVVTKSLDASTARKFLAEAGGDREKARQLAKEQGYTF